MDFIGTVLKTSKDSLRLRNRTIDFEDAWHTFPEWNPNGAYGFELELPTNEYKRHGWMHNWFLDNDFVSIGYPVPMYTRDKWSAFETRSTSLRLYNLLTYVDTFVLRYHIGDDGVFIGKRNRTLWVEEVIGAGMWISPQEMFAY